MSGNFTYPAEYCCINTDTPWIFYCKKAHGKLYKRGKNTRHFSDGLNCQYNKVVTLCYY